MNEPRPVDRLPVGLIGDGRLARHMDRYLVEEGVPVRRWWRGREDTPAAALDGCGIAWALISDAAIEPFFATAGLDHMIRLHASGSVVTPCAWGLHPLCTFGPEPYELDFYRRIHFVSEEGGPSFRELFPSLPNPEHRIGASDRALYHAACVLGGNGSMILWAGFFRVLESLRIPPAAGAPYVEKSCENVIRHGGQALTGPLARGDRDTVRANLAALADDPLADVYRALARAIDPDLLETTA